MYDIPKLSEFVTVEEGNGGMFKLSLWTIDGDEKVLFTGTSRPTLDSMAETIKDTLATWDDDPQTYQIVRFRQNAPSHFVKGGLTLKEAQEHCRRDDTHGDGWFDGYEAE